MLDLETLLAPIPGPLPCGPDLLFSPAFDAIQLARLHDDAFLDQGEWIIPLKEADWPFVIDACQKLLRESTKDLRLGVWLAEALASRHGFAGLGAAYRLLAGLCERHWDGLHPLAEDGDIDNDIRFGSIGWLASCSIDLLQAAPIVNDGQAAYGFGTWERALALDQAVRRTPSSADELTRDKVTTEQFDRVRRATPASFLKDLHADLLACEQSVAHFEQVIDACMQAQGPSFARVQEKLASIRQAAERFARDAGISLGRQVAATAQPAPMASEESLQRIERMLATPAAPAPIAVAPALHGSLQTRAQAIAQLDEIAAFLERTEPSSPATYMARKAAAWASLPLHAWLRSVIRNEQELAQLEDLLGVRSEPSMPGGA